MSAADVRRVKRLAQRLGARDSDVIRFALKAMLVRLEPLCDPEIRGRALVPVFVEAGADLLRFFELDFARLETIINEGAQGDRRVDRDDVALLAMTAQETRYALLRLSALNGDVGRNGSRATGADGDAASGETLRQYLYAKYVYRANGATDESLVAAAR